jgi:2-oxoglutarate dehydrogenase E2 component (dihydrolipoamide succinyltransferase)
MSSEITVPTLGESIVEATVASWLKHPGEAVAIGDPVVELETEKVNMEIVATVSGILESIRKQEGETVAIGDILGVISDEDATNVQETGAKTSHPQSG